MKKIWVPLFCLIIIVGMISGCVEEKQKDESKNIIETLSKTKIVAWLLALIGIFLFFICLFCLGKIHSLLLLHIANGFGKWCL